MDTEKNLEVVQKYVSEFWSQGKVELASELISPDYTRSDPASSFVTGDREGVKQLNVALRSAFPDLNFTINEVVTSEGKVVVRWLATGTHQGDLLGIPPTGKSVAIMGTSIYHLSSGQLVGEWTVWDSMGMMQQIGAIPSLG